jgi:Xaa-Pro aminopeptidase
MTLNAIMSENTVKNFHAQFQTFDDPAETSDAVSRLAALRAELARRGLDGFVVPHADRHQNEYLPPSEERLAWITGFTGSAGAAIILADRAVLFVDGRYTLQALDQVDPKLFAIEHLVDKPPSAWIESNLKTGQKLGFDPWLHTAEGAERLAKACSSVGAILVATEPNPIDAACRNRVAPPHGAIVPHDLKFAGEPAPQKLERIRAEIAKLNADALVVSDAHAVAWTFNIRGADVSHTPLPLAFAIILADGARLYVEESKLTDAARTALAGLADVRSEDTFAQDLAALGAEHLVVRIDQSTAAHAISQAITANGGKVLRGPDPIAIMKAVKNDAEIAGSKAAHRRDGAAVTNFLAWFDRAAAGGDLTEIEAVEALETFRRDTGLLRDVSFPTISGAGPNGAIVHYRVTRKTNRKIVPGELFLIDSGAQYEDGTTDITRTVIVGDPSPEMRDRFTRVLKGHIAIARAVFPDGISGSQLDSFARTHLWGAGIDFDHGTGHGVGSYLSVHEGPARIAKLGTEPLRRGMILSNEPGYYKAGHYGIRIENLVLVAEAPAVAGGEKPLNRFETLTLAPIDLRLIDRQLMAADEIHWLDAYHAEVRETLMPRVAADTREWLAAATAPFKRG